MFAFIFLSLWFFFISISLCHSLLTFILVIASFCMWDVSFLMLNFSFVCLLTHRPLPIIPQNLHLNPPHSPRFLIQNALPLSISHLNSKEVSPSPLQWPIRRLWGRISRPRGWGAQCRYCLHVMLLFEWAWLLLYLLFAHTFICDAQLGSFRLRTHYRWW